MAGWLNYHHLLYFWTVVREGSVTAAARSLGLAQPTLSSQIRSLEASLGTRLLERQGRQLRLTAAGQSAFRYADEIFGLGQELQATLTGGGLPSLAPLTVGISDALPKLLARQLLEPALKESSGPRLVCWQDRTDRLLAQLGLHEVELVLADQPLPPGSPIRAFTHELGRSAVAFFASAELRAEHPGAFPRCLENAPVLLPTKGTALRRSLDDWFEAAGLRPRVVAECSDSALLKTFGQGGYGFFPAPQAVAREVVRQYQVKRVGLAKGVEERLFALTLERRVRRPEVQALLQAARLRLGAA
ncbi:MAG TPA: LysR family transcriptional regulator [Holophagaceae bacterium]|nr:LysR family transcriptional regulator [Holophagaceae bacterium]